MLGADSSRSDFAAGHSVAVADHDNVEIHTENAGGRIVLQTQIDVLGDAESEATSGRKVLFLQLVLLDLEATVKDLIGLEATDSDVHGDLLVTADTESSDGVSGYKIKQNVQKQYKRKQTSNYYPWSRLASCRSAAQEPWQHE